jgi:hypothetical protein
VGQGSDRMSFVYLANFQAFLHKTLFGINYQLTNNQLLSYLKFKLNLLRILGQKMAYTRFREDLFG